MSKWIAEFDLEDGDMMPEHMDLEYNGVQLDFHCRPMWIPVNEKLPEDGEKVLVTYGNVVKRATWDLMRDSFYDTYAASLDKDFVYAWMSLPEPYKVESGEE